MTKTQPECQLGMQSSLPSLSTVSPAEAILLGSPIGIAPAINSVILSKIQALQSLGERLKLLHAHDALCLLQHVLAIPKVLYILRTAGLLSITFT